jgi:hypothetical protein
MAFSVLPKPDKRPLSAPAPLDFFSEFVWLDGRRLIDTIEPYRQRILTDVLWTFDPDGAPTFNMALCGRAKKNWKTSDLILAGLYRLLAWQSVAGNDCLIAASDDGQAGDDLTLATDRSQSAARPSRNGAAEGDRAQGRSRIAAHPAGSRRRGRAWQNVSLSRLRRNS